MPATYNILSGEIIKECSYVLLLMCDIGDILASPKYLGFSDFRNEAILCHSTALDRSSVISADNRVEDWMITRVQKLNWKDLLAHVTAELQVKFKKGKRMEQVGMDNRFVLNRSKFKVSVTHLVSSRQSCWSWTDSASANSVSPETSPFSQVQLLLLLVKCYWTFLAVSHPTHQHLLTSI